MKEKVVAAIAVISFAGGAGPFGRLVINSRKTFAEIKSQIACAYLIFKSTQRFRIAKDQHPSGMNRLPLPVYISCANNSFFKGLRGVMDHEKK